VSDDLELTAGRIAERGRRELLGRLRTAFEQQAAAGIATVDSADLDRLIADAATRADAALWRRALAQAAADELGIGLSEAIADPTVERAAEIVGAPAWHGPPTITAPPQDATPAEPEQEPEPEPEPEPAHEPEPAPEALRLSAVHLSGIETLRTGDRDLELRLSTGGLDVLKRSSGAAIGRLEWSEIRSIELSQPRRGLRTRRRRVRVLHVVTERGKAGFELPGLTDEQLSQHLEPMLAQMRQLGSSEPHDRA
jgi:hypothetical protein